MAEKIKIAELEIDDKALLKSMTDTKKSIQDVSDAQAVLKISGEQNSEQFVKNQAKLKTLNQEYGRQLKVLQAVSNSQKKLDTELRKEIKSLDSAAANNKKLREIRNQVNATTKEGKAQLEAINKKINQNTKFIKENTSDLEKQKMNVGNYKSALEGVFPKMGLFNSAIAKGRALLDAARGAQAAHTVATKAGGTATGGLTKALRVLKFALIATGIGAIVVVLGSLVGMLANTQKGTDFVSKAMEGLKAAFAVITDRISALGGAFAKFFSGDFEGGFNDMQEALKGIGDEIVNETKAAYDLEAALQAVEDKENSLIVTKAKRLKQIAELRIQAKEESRSLKERAALLEEAGNLEKANLADAMEIAVERARISQEQVDLGESTRDEIRQNQELQAEVFNLEKRSLDLQRSIVTERESLLKRDSANVKANKVAEVNEEKAKNKELDTEAKKAAEKKLADHKTYSDQLRTLEEEIEIAKLETEQERDELALEYELQKHLAEVDRLTINEEEKGELIALIRKRYDQQMQDIHNQYNNQEAASDEELQAKKIAGQTATLSAIEGLAGAETGIGKAVLVAKQALAVKEAAINLGKFTKNAGLKASEAVVDTAAGTVKSAASAPFPANLPLIAGFIGSIGGLMGTIKSAMTGAKSGSKFAQGGILSGASHAAGGIQTPYGELEGGEAVINKRSTALFRPILSRLNEAGGGKKFAQGGILGADSNALSSSMNYDILAAKMAQAVAQLPAPVVGVDEISAVANRVNVIENTASL